MAEPLATIALYTPTSEHQLVTHCLQFEKSRSTIKEHNLDWIKSLDLISQSHHHWSSITSMVAIIVKPVCRQVVLSQALPLNTQEVKPNKNKNHKSPDRLMDSSSEVNCKGKHNIFKWTRQQQQAKKKIGAVFRMFKKTTTKTHKNPFCLGTATPDVSLRRGKNKTRRGAGWTIPLSNWARSQNVSSQDELQVTTQHQDCHRDSNRTLLS